MKNNEKVYLVLSSLSYYDGGVNCHGMFRNENDAKSCLDEIEKLKGLVYWIKELEFGKYEEEIGL